MILLLLGGVLAQGILGLYALEHNEIVAGPLMRTISFETAEAVTKLHVQGFYLLLVFVAVHVLTNLAYAFLKREPLLRAMITGKKPTDDYVDQQEATVVPRVGVRAAVCLGVAASIVFGGIVVLGGRL
jgi:cytochrome b